MDFSSSPVRVKPLCVPCDCWGTRSPSPVLLLGGPRSTWSWPEPLRLTERCTSLRGDKHPSLGDKGDRGASETPAGIYLLEPIPWDSPQAEQQRGEGGNPKPIALAPIVQEGGERSKEGVFFICFFYSFSNHFLRVTAEGNAAPAAGRGFMGCTVPVPPRTELSRRALDVAQALWLQRLCPGGRQQPAQEGSRES